jgi:hypothetical protein
MVAVERAVGISQEPVKTLEILPSPKKIRNPLCFRPLEDEICPVCELRVFAGQDAISMPSQRDVFYHPVCFFEGCSNRSETEAEKVDIKKLLLRLFDGGYVPVEGSQDKVDGVKIESPFYYFLKNIEKGEEPNSKISENEFILEKGSLKFRENGLAPYICGKILTFSDLPHQIFISKNPVSDEQIGLLDRSGFTFVFGPPPEYTLMQKSTEKWKISFRQRRSINGH